MMIVCPVGRCTMHAIGRQGMLGRADTTRDFHKYKHYPRTYGGGITRNHVRRSQGRFNKGDLFSFFSTILFKGMFLSA